jgi:hypothetical protein
MIAVALTTSFVLPSRGYFPGIANFTSHWLQSKCALGVPSEPAANCCGHAPNGSCRGGVCKCFHPGKTLPVSARHPFPEAPLPMWTPGLRMAASPRHPRSPSLSARAANGGSGAQPAEFQGLKPPNLPARFRGAEAPRFHTARFSGTAAQARNTFQKSFRLRRSSLLGELASGAV